MIRFGIRAIALLLVCMLTGCSLLYSYRNIDRYIRWSLGDYISWDDTQYAQLRARLHSQLDWHQQTQLPRYRAWLERIDRELDGNVDASELRNDADQLQLFWQDAMAHAQHDIAAQLALLSDKQVHDLIAAMREKQADVKAEYDDMSVAELIKKRKHDMRKQAKYWLGSLDDNQTALIAVWAEQLPDGREQWLSSRAHWTDAFERALQHRQESTLFNTEIQRLFVTPQENWDEQYRDLSQRSLDAALQLLAALHNSRSEQQRQHERERIGQWLTNLEHLALP